MGFPLSILGAPVKGIIDSVGGILDKLTTTDDEKNKAKIELYKLQTTFLTQMEAASTEFAKQQASVVIAEAQGESWMQRNWRPSLMFTFMFIIAWNFIIHPIVTAFTPALPVVVIPDQMWDLLKLGMTGYIVGRSGEYIAESWAEGQKNKAAPTLK